MEDQPNAGPSTHGAPVDEKKKTEQEQGTAAAATETPKAAAAPPGGAVKPPRGLFWSLMDQDRPERNETNRENFRKTVQKLGVAGTMGALFTAIIRNLPVTLAQHVQPYNWNYTADLLMRYAYLTWLLVYFVVSNSGFDASGYKRVKGDFSYDIGQALGTLLAAYFLGFVTFEYTRYEMSAYVVTNVVICGICFVAWWWFKGQTPSTNSINRMRFFGGSVSLLSTGFAAAVWAVWRSNVPTWVFGVFAAAWALLTFALGSFIRIRFDVGSRSAA